MYDKRRLQTCRPQTCRLTDTFGTHGGREVIDQYLVFCIFYCREELVTVRQLLLCNPQGRNLLTFIHFGGRSKTDLASGTHEDKNSHDLLKSQKMQVCKSPSVPVYRVWKRFAGLRSVSLQSAFVAHRFRRALISNNYHLS